MFFTKIIKEYQEIISYLQLQVRIHDRRLDHLENRILRIECIHDCKDVEFRELSYNAMPSNVEYYWSQENARRGVVSYYGFKKCKRCEKVLEYYPNKKSFLMGKKINFMAIENSIDREIADIKKDMQG